MNILKNRGTAMKCLTSTFAVGSFLLISGCSANTAPEPSNDAKELEGEIERTLESDQVKDIADRSGVNEDFEESKSKLEEANDILEEKYSVECKDPREIHNTGLGFISCSGGDTLIEVAYIPHELARGGIATALNELNRQGGESFPLEWDVDFTRLSPSLVVGTTDVLEEVRDTIEK